MPPPLNTHVASRDDAKALAAVLRGTLAERGIAIAHGQALDLVARQFGCRDWNHLAALVPEQVPPGAPRFLRTCPVLRIFDEAKARAFYLDFLGFRLDWEHRFAPDAPLYAQVSRAGLLLHLSAHHGDATPGATVFVGMEQIALFHAELTAKDNPQMRPGLDRLDWGIQMEVTDPFANRIRFCEQRHGG
ncbi:glyoxalase superfamily protein [Ancylobacter sp. 6x-1]|uniref:Glyoxalase superfamily protein n=1 Tax=Ancylobacter crimeensis TaxID=2579147 RepID=A0ABT0DCL7_9HYPH|nr:glyoxalase superfamily protein [Ancylobacter crimeensis]MCK0197614.1 glyoxalase superfamily protein [Ancylobacter crimeensis]